ncbi:MAG: hypothetical protein CL582_16830, partial [Alteromonadaceae bacterium]|nr:hypothetical protein [Alteromonadaceae bacterium]
MSNKKRGNRKGRQSNKQTIPDDIRRGTSYQSQKPNKGSEEMKEQEQSQTEVVVDNPPQMTKVEEGTGVDDKSTQTEEVGEKNMSEDSKVKTTPLVLFDVEQNGNRVRRAELEVPMEVGKHSLSRLPNKKVDHGSATLAHGVRFEITEDDLERGDVTEAVKRFN